MKAILADGQGGLALYDVPVPQLGAAEVLIRVKAAGINRADILQRKGKYDPPPGASDVLGMECAGEIAAIGPQASRWKIGEAVMALMAGGAQAEYAAVPAAQCLPVPTGFSMIEAGATPEAVATVWANLFEAAQLKPFEAALIHGGSSGIGTFAIQMLRAFNITPIVTVGSAEKAEACRKLGAALAVNYHEKDFVKEVLDFTETRGVDAVLDMVGGDYVNRNLQALAKFGRHVSIATQHGTKAEIDLRLVMMKQLVLTGSTLRARPAPEKARLMREVEAQLLPLLSAGKIKPVVFQVFPLEKAGEAHKVMETSAHIGKLVLAV